MLLALSNKINPTDLAGKNITPHCSLKYVAILISSKAMLCDLCLHVHYLLLIYNYCPTNMGRKSVQCLSN